MGKRWGGHPVFLSMQIERAQYFFLVLHSPTWPIVFLCFRLRVPVMDHDETHS
jgi:hypothetical protein